MVRKKEPGSALQLIQTSDKSKELRKKSTKFATFLIKLKTEFLKVMNRDEKLISVENSAIDPCIQMEVRCQAWVFCWPCLCVAAGSLFSFGAETEFERPRILV